MVRKCSFSNVSGARGGDDYLHFIAMLDIQLMFTICNRRIFFTIKGQIISECSYEIIVYPKIATKKFPRFLSWKFTTSRLTQKESLCSVCKKIDSVLY